MRLTAHHIPFGVARMRLRGWREKSGGRWTKTVPMPELSDELAALGRAFADDAPPEREEKTRAVYARA